MGKHSRDKGARGEREVAAIIGADKISTMYGKGPDLIWGDYLCEVKRRANGFKSLYKWLNDDAQILLMRADREDWLICMRLNDYLDKNDKT